MTILFGIALVLAWSLSMAPTAHATSDCLGLPTEAAELWKDFFPCCFDEETCKELCGKWEKTCENFVSVAHQCQSKTAEESLDLEKAVECGTQEDKSSRKQCNKDITSDRSDFISSLKENLIEAKEICFECFDECFEHCIGAHL
jgi:hypothetical protein